MVKYYVTTKKNKAFTNVLMERRVLRNYYKGNIDKTRGEGGSK